MGSNKEIIALNDFEHVLIRPTIYVGSVEPSEEKIPIIRDGKIISDVREISVGFYKLMIEILDNAFDEAKRMKGGMKRIEIHFDSKTNTVKVVDTGGGFINASAINSKTGISNVASAMSMLRAGSNFKNQNTAENLIGTNGVGASVVNMLSDKFTVKTVNETESYSQTWNKFIPNDPEIEKHESGETTGTTVSFTPRKDTFKHCKWDKDYVHSMMIFKQFLKKTDPTISKLEFVCTWDNEQLDLDVNFIPEIHYKADSKIGTIFVWESFSQSSTVTFVNGAICGGIHHRIIVDWLNEVFQSTSAYRFYECFIVLNLPPNVVSFGDQNKTKFDTARKEILPILEKHFYPPIKRNLKNSEVYENILKRISDSEHEGDVRNLRNKKKAQKAKISDKYFPPSEKCKNLFIVEGGCIDENEKIDIYRDYERMRVSMNELTIEDEVLTHKNRYKSISNVQRKLKECVSITTSTGTLRCSLKQPLYVFDMIEKKFKFISVKDLDKSYHKLVKSLLGKFIGNLEVISTEITSDEKYPVLLILEDGTELKNSLTHKYCVMNDDGFKMKQSQFIESGDLIALFEDTI